MEPIQSGGMSGFYKVILRLLGLESKVHRNALESSVRGPVAQWIRHRPTEAGMLLRSRLATCGPALGPPLKPLDHPHEMESRALLSSLTYRQQGTLVSLSLCEARSVSGVHTRTLGQVCTPCIGDWT